MISQINLKQKKLFIELMGLDLIRDGSRRFRHSESSHMDDKGGWESAALKTIIIFLLGG